MKNIFIKTMAAAVLTLGMTGCVNDLDISSIDPQSSPSATDMGLLAKCYGVLGLTGQRGGSGNGDLSLDEGESGFYRTTFNLQELPTDECMWAWQNDDDIPQITMINWNSSSHRTQWAYTRLTYDITLFNSYLAQVADNDENRQYRAEVRFLRALHYWYLLDLFGKAPFKTEFNITELPVEYSGNQMYRWIDQELTDIEAEMTATGTGVGAFNNSENFGRADLGAVYLLHARLALNAPVYSDTVSAETEYRKAIDYCNRIEQSGVYQLSQVEKNGNSGYAQLFMADNDQNIDAMREIILPIRQDGLRTRQYGGSLLLIAGPRSANMPDYGMTASWTCYFARRAMTEKFFPSLSNVPLISDATLAAIKQASDEKRTLTRDDYNAFDAQDGTTMNHVIAAAGDDRAMLYSGSADATAEQHRTISAESVTNFMNGLSIVKWTNLRSDNTAGSDVSWPDTDIPFLRYAEIFLIRAEANWRLGESAETVMNDINQLRRRANTRLFAAADITEENIRDEWCREFFMEGRRRSDLVRFGCFTGSKYIWDWKGGVPNGTTIASHFDVYPIPADDITNNANMTQNPGY